ncbi:MAG: acyl-CoA carboxylase subunit epsilon [Streptomyces sp.]|jgi:hypothetical protein|nr:acyl-CoA carboxylase subunit epsilon [Streptomyces sp.]
MSKPATDGETLIRVEKGEPTEAELAALTAVLLTRAAVSEDAAPDTGARATARWSRLERSAGHRQPRSWQGGAGHRSTGA